MVNGICSSSLSADGALSLLFKVLTNYIQSPSSALSDDLLAGQPLTTTARLHT